MYYFIPSWFGQERFWQSDLQPWYWMSYRLEFDDILHQIRIFKSQEIASKLLLLSYHPHTRYVLHRQDVLELEYFSAFDAIQGIGDEPMHPLQLKDLDWDAYCDFIYTPFLVVVKRHHELHAHVEFGAEGYISHIHYFEDNHIYRTCYFDDRGFVSSIVVYENQAPSYRYYLNPAGQWQIREQLQGEEQTVEVNPEVAYRFHQSRYASIGELVWEVLNDFISVNYHQGDRFVIASKESYNAELIQHLPAQSEKILTFFVERNQGDDLTSYLPVLAESQLVISDRKDFLLRLQEKYPQYANKMHHLPSFDTRLKLGISQRLKESKIFVQLDLQSGLDENVAYYVLKYVSEEPLTEVVFVTYNAQGYQIEHLENQLNTLIANRLSLSKLLKDTSIEGAENALLENEKEDYRFRIQNINDETALLQELEYTRLLVDLNTEVNVYTQIAGISAGIPQVNLQPSEYVEHLKNGFILSDVSEFEGAAHHFLDTLKYWNESLIYSIDKIRENTGDQFIEKWERWLEESKHGK